MFLYIFIPLDPNLIPQVQTDFGAIKFILGGADVMCPGLTSQGGKLPDHLQVGHIVVHYKIYLMRLILRLSWLRRKKPPWPLVS